MRNIIFYTPPKLVFGPGSLDQFIDDYLQSGLKYLYLITVPAVISSLDQLIGRMNNAGVNMEIFDQLQGEPTFSQFEIILGKARNFGTDSVAGIGGGSVMDVSKLLAAQLKNALEGIRLISRNLYKAWQNGKDIEARANIALGSVYGGICLGPVNTAAVHALAYPLGSMYKIAHGLSNALLLPYIMEFNLETSLSRHVDVAIALGSQKGKSDKETALNGIMVIRKLIKDCNLLSCLAEINIPEVAIPVLAESTMQVKRLLKNNIRDITYGDAISIYQKAMRG